jgi:hypothetical protein
MQLDLRDYIKIYDIIPKDICDKSISELQNITWSKHSYSDNLNHYSHNGDNELDNSWDEISTKNTLMELFRNGIETYILTDFNFSWYTGWAGYSRIRFNRYNVDQIMDLHCDHITDLFDGTRKGIPTLSVLASLNDDYEGGDFVMFDDYHVRLKAGQIMIFPSNFLYPHKVEKVTKGSRYTCISWVW